MSVFQLAAAGVESQEERSEADRRAEAQPALTVAAPADSWGEEELLDTALDACEASWQRGGFWERYCMRWATFSFALALASRLEKHWSSEWLG